MLSSIAFLAQDANDAWGIHLAYLLTVSAK
jgi:hypothetical protein